MIIPLGLIIIVGALLWLDRVFMFQLMLSRPIIMAPILCSIMGEFYLGFLIGASLELLWLNSPPVGAYLPNDDSFCAAIASPVAVYAHLFMNETASAGLALVMSIPFSIVGRAIEMRLRSLNQELIPENISNMESTISRALARSLSRAFICSLICICLSVSVLCCAVFLAKDYLRGPAAICLSYMPSVTIIIGLAGLIFKGVPRLKHIGMFAIGIAVIVIATWII